MDINFKKIESKWQKAWEKDKVFVASEGKKKPKYYVLEMFPYPSGDGLHMGHALNYTIGDVLARFKKMQGFEVLYPAGYDSLGLPAENAAIKAGTHPKEYTDKSIKNFMMQQKSLGISYDWSRVLSTANPDYYRWDQWIFLKMFEKGLAYQKESAVNWCPSCKTVIANEQAQEGKCERCESKVEIKHLKQWFFKITEYADELYEKIDELVDWPERTKAMQKNWIGKSHGTQIDFEINGKSWPIFTTSPDTIYGVTFMVVSAQHAKLDSLIKDEQKKEVEDFLKKIGSVSQKSMKEVEELDKVGVFTGSYAINPANGEKIPVYAGNFVVADYGSGMVMAVPAHDQRDYEFAKKYGIQVRQVIEGEMNDGAYTGEGNLINSNEFDGRNSREAITLISQDLINKGAARSKVNFRLKDWGISRQRYWGTPIPIVHCEKCGKVPVSEKDLPVKLPMKVKFGKGNPLETAQEWLNVKCPKCGGAGRRESDTMDTFVNSSWYFLRYCDPDNNKKIFDKEKVKKWCPIDTYIGGAEHACMHLIYFRFYTKFLRDIGLLDFDEPAKVLFHQGYIYGEGGIKMSKSKGNIVAPIEISKKYGSDTLRYFLLSLAEPEKPRDWNEKGISGSLRFIKKIFSVFENVKQGKSSEGVRDLVNEIVIEVTKDIETFRYRMATIKIKTLFENLSKEKEVAKEDLEKTLKILSPFCPHIAEELWDKIGNKKFVSLESWPEVKESKKKSKEEDVNEKIINYVNEMTQKIKGKKEYSKVYLYVIPNEKEKIDLKKVGSEIGKELIVFATNELDKYDPENKSKKSRPGLPGVYFE